MSAKFVVALGVLVAVLEPHRAKAEHPLALLGGERVGLVRDRLVLDAARERARVEGAVTSNETDFGAPRWLAESS